MRSQPSRVHAARTSNAKEVSFMSRLAVIAVLALGAPATALAHGASATHKSVANEKGQHRLVLGGNVASIDGSAKAAVLSLGGSRGKLVTLDLSHTSVRLVSKHGRAKAGALADVHAEDRVFVDLTVSAKVAHADATAGVSVPVKRLIDEGVPSSRAATRFENPTVSGLVQIVAGEQVTIAHGDGTSATAVTLDLTGAKVYAGRPPVAADASSVLAGDRVLANLAVPYETIKADLKSGTAIPVAKLYDLGAPALPAPPAPEQPVVLGGSVASIGSGQITITFGDSGESHTATLDISAASIYVGHSSATATASSASALSVGDRVYAVLSVSSEIASGDVRSGTPIPVSKLYDAGAPTPPTGG
jgi:hypothetical protein